MKWGAVLAFAGAALAQEPEQEQKRSLKPIQKVVALLKEMRSTMEKDQKADEEFHDKMTCWCNQNEEKKGEAVKAAEARLEELTNEINMQTATAAKAATVIEVETKEIAKLVANIKQQMGKLKEDYDGHLETTAEQRDMIATLNKALDALQGKKSALEVKQSASFLQLKQVMTGNKFSDLMRKDLFAVLGAMNDNKESQASDELSTADLFDEMFSGKRSRVLTDLTQGDVNPPSAGPVSKAKSYNSRAGQIVGIISEMHDEAKRELQQEIDAFKSSALAAIQLAGGQRELADAGMNQDFAKYLSMDWDSIEDGSMVRQRKTKEAKLKQAKEEKAAAEKAVADAERAKKNTKESLSADNQALIEITEKCKEGGEEYAARQAERAGEIKAVGEALSVLTADASRDLFASSMPSSFLQLSAKTETMMRNRVATVVMRTARRLNSLHLASLAVRAQLDSFSKVKEMMDKMAVELKKQQVEESKTRDSCRGDLKENESSQVDANNLQEDLKNEIQDMSSQIEKLTETINVAKEQVASEQIATKQAGENRDAENKEYQQTVQDQRMTVNVLNRALGKLQAFYNKEALMQQPGAATKDMPKSKEFKQQGAAPGVMGLMQEIIADAKQLEKEAIKDEQSAQTEYENFVTDSSNSVEAASNTINTSEKQMGALEKTTSQRKQDLLSNTGEVDALVSKEKNLHGKCDFLLKNFELRQESRQEEIDAIAQAKAVLSGASFS